MKSTNRQHINKTNLPFGQTCPLSCRFERVTRKNTVGNSNVLTISAQNGLVNQLEYYNQQYASENTSGYTLLKKGEFAYNKSYSDGYPWGAIKRLSRYEEGIVSPIYLCFAAKPGTCSEFYEQYFEAGLLNREIYRIAQEGARNHGLLNIATDDFFHAQIIDPPIEEQKRIAEILECCDKVIRLKRELIEEKKKQKKSLMQKLLNPDSGFRLPGFNGEWKKDPLGELCQTFSGGTPSRDNGDYYGGTIPWLKSGELNSRIIVKTEEYITPLALNSSSAKMVRAGTLLLALYGATAGVIAITKIDVAINQAILAIENSDVIDTNYLYYSLLNQIDIAKNRFTQGGQPNFNAGIIRSLLLDYPEKLEQQAIATILSSADREIDLLEQDLAQWEQKKKSLAQLLITGKVRV